MWRRAARCTPCRGCFGNDLPVLLLAPLENRYRLAQGLQFLAGLGLGVGSVIAGATLLQEVGKLRGGTLMLAFQRRQLTILRRQLAFEGLDPLQCLLQYLVLQRLALAHNCGRGLAARHSIRWVIIGRVFTHIPRLDRVSPGPSAAPSWHIVLAFRHARWCGVLLLVGRSAPVQH